MRRFACLVLLAVAALAPAAAQRRNDQARLSFGVGFGYNGDARVWKVQGQELIDDFTRDTGTFTRDVRPTIGVVFIGAYYPDDHWGITGEAHLIGLGYEDGCTLQTASGSSQNDQICTSINGQQSRGTTVATTIGAMYRPLPWSDFQPYLRVNAGLLVSQLSAIRMRGTFVNPDTQLVDYFVFGDAHPASVSPTVGLAGGMTAFVSRSYQLRFEVKDNIVSLEHVTSTAALPSEEPRSERKLHHVFSMTIGLEVVLEKKRGRRY
jgi:hypothetical protein